MSKRTKPFAATRASTKHLEAEGWTVACVETRIPHTFITRDLWNFADLICMSPSRGIMLVQVTGGTGMSNFNARVAKVRAEARAGLWLASGGRIQVHTWNTQKGTKERKLTILEITTIEAEEKLPNPAKSSGRRKAIVCPTDDGC